MSWNFNHDHGNDPAACARPGSDHKEEPPVASTTIPNPEASRLAQPPGPEAVERMHSTVVGRHAGNLLGLTLAESVASALEEARCHLRGALKELDGHGEPASSASAIHEAIAQVDSVMEALTGGERS